MRLGGPVFEKWQDPEQWAQAHRRLGYSAAYVPNQAAEAPEAFVAAAKKAGLVLAEVGAWSNPISTNAEERQKALALCCQRLELAERVGARCCVNIAGSRGARWDGPDPANLNAETRDLIVASVREIIDTVKPTRTSYALETMPWVWPDSPESYLELVKAIDRKQFAVHLDPVNMVNCPRRAYDTGAFIRECFAILGPMIKSCHAKDIKFSGHLTLHLDECRPGTGVLDYRVFLTELSRLAPDTPLMLEHLPTAEEYELAAAFVRKIAQEEQVRLV